jgi:predicted nucleotidyltransferase
MNQQIFKEIQTLKRRILPKEKVILFGSQARGDAHEDSDWDLLVLLDKSHKEPSDEDKAFQFVLTGWKYGAYFSIKMYTTEQWEKGSMFPFYKNVMHEGIEIN